MTRKIFQGCALLMILNIAMDAQVPKRARDHGIKIGVLKTGSHNAITDVAGVLVGQTTIRQGDTINTGVTAILPHEGNVFQQKVPAAIYLGNGFGKLMGYSQVEELGNIETPIVLTNTLSVPAAANAVISYTLSQPENADVRSVNAVVGETNDGRLNDIRGRHVKEPHVLDAIRKAATGPVTEGNVGGGHRHFLLRLQRRGRDRFPGIAAIGRGIYRRRAGANQLWGRTPNRRRAGGRKIGALLHARPGGRIARRLLHDRGGDRCPPGCPQPEAPGQAGFSRLGKTGGIASNGSGDYIIAFSADPGFAYSLPGAGAHPGPKSTGQLRCLAALHGRHRSYGRGGHQFPFCRRDSGDSPLQNRTITSRESIGNHERIRSHRMKSAASQASDIGVIILAAGASRRMGRPKQLLEYEGQTLLNRVIGICRRPGGTSGHRSPWSECRPDPAYDL